MLEATPGIVDATPGIVDAAQGYVYLDARKNFSLTNHSHMKLKFSYSSFCYGGRVPGPSQDLRRQLHKVAFGQSGYFSAAQAKEVGYSYQAQKYHVDHGNWLRVDRGLFRLPEWPSGPADTYARWVLWSGGVGVISHDSALAVHGLSDVNPARVHLTVPVGFRARDDAVILHTGRLADRDIERRGSWQLTSVDRTLLDIADGDTSQEIVDQTVSDALERSMTTPRRLLRLTANASDRAALRLERALTRAKA